MKYKTTPITMSVHPEDGDPIIGESAMHVSLRDYGAGPILSIKQVSNGYNEPSEVGEIQVEIEELEAIVKAARKMMHGVKEDEK